MKPTLPAGYRLQECKEASSRSGWHGVYSDGLDLLSVFSLVGKKRQTPTGTKVRVGRYPGYVSRQSHHWRVTWNEEARQWTVIGDLSRDLALQIARVVAQG
jgi:hypothetical protein